MSSPLALNDILPEARARARKLFTEAFCRGLAPPPVLTVSEWADEYRFLSSKTSAEPGQWRTTRVPYTREIMDCLSPADPVTDVVFMKGTQVAGTECGNNWIGYVIDQSPGPMMMVLPTSNTAKRSSKTRIAPMIEDCPVLRDKVKEHRSRDSGNTLLAKEFQGGILAIAGANSSAELRSMPIRFLFCDEIDAYPDDVDEEGDPVALAEKRTDTFFRKKRYCCSSPKIKDRSRIEKKYKASDQRRYFVPCPHCESQQWLKWKQVRWETIKHRELSCSSCGGISFLNKDGLEAHECDHCSVNIQISSINYIERNTEDVSEFWYECEHCNEPIHEHHKTWMLENGKWIAQNPGPGRAAGFHLSALYSPLGWFSWRDAIVQFLAAEKSLDPRLKQVFVNTVLAETYEKKGEQPVDADIKLRAEPYHIATVPAGGLLLTAAVDVQADRLEVKVKAWGRGDESWLVDYQQIHGDPTQDFAWDELTNILNKGYLHASGTTLRITAMAVDSGYLTHHVYNYCRKMARRHVFAVKGQSRPGKPILGKPIWVDVNYKGKTQKNGVKLWLIGTDTAKELIYGRLKIEKPAPGYMHFPRGLPDTYFEQLTAEKMVQTYVKGFLRYSFEKEDSKRNEALDLEVYAYAAAIYAGIARVNWDHLEQVINPSQKNIFVEYTKRDERNDTPGDPGTEEGGSQDPPAAVEKKTEPAPSGLFNARRRRVRSPGITG